jgi:hypothetical protein
MSAGPSLFKDSPGRDIGVVPDPCPDHRWVCVGHNPTRWALAKLDEVLERPSTRAVVVRLKDGQWQWRTRMPCDSGIVPSREEAMVATEERLGGK